jgi:hypothetical protein
VTPLSWVLLAAFALALAVGAALWLRARGRRAEEARHQVQCPNCGRLARFGAGQAGRRGQCPGCRLTLTYPRDPS